MVTQVHIRLNTKLLLVFQLQRSDKLALIVEAGIACIGYRHRQMSIISKFTLAEIFLQWSASKTGDLDDLVGDRDPNIRYLLWQQEESLRLYLTEELSRPRLGDRRHHLQDGYRTYRNFCFRTRARILTLSVEAIAHIQCQLRKLSLDVTNSLL